MRNLLLGLLLFTLAACEITCDDIEESSAVPVEQTAPSLTELAQPVEEMEVRAEVPQRPAERPAPEPAPAEVPEAQELPEIDQARLLPEQLGRRIEALSSPLVNRRIELGVPLNPAPSAQ
jgi:hypothetical protein